MRYITSILLLLSLLVLGGCEIPSVDTPDDPFEPPTNHALPTLTTVVFSIGKADAILIHNESHAILIDTGEVEDATEVLSYLQKKNITQLDAMILTHYDKDHVGGAAGILEGIAVNKVYGTYVSKQSTEYDLYKKALIKKELTDTIIREETSLSYGDIHITIYPPRSEKYNTKESNNSSLIIHMTYGKTKYFFGADAQEERITELLSLGTKLDCDFMKVPYHGSMIENLPALLSITTPDYAVITCSDKNPVTTEKITSLRDVGSRIFLTRAGNVYATSDGLTLTVRH